MRIPKTLLAIIVTGILLSCQTEEERTAQKAIDRYIIFVDSVNKAKADKRRERWDFIEKEQQRKKADAEAALYHITENRIQKQRDRIAKRDSVFQGVRVSVKNN